MSHEAAIDVDVVIKNEDIMEAASTSKTWSETETKAAGSKRQSFLERMRSSKSKSKESSSEAEEDLDEESDPEDIKPAADQEESITNRKRKKGAEMMQLKKPPSFQKQTSRYEDRLRNEDLAVQAAFEKRKESKKLSQQEDKKIKSKTGSNSMGHSEELIF